MTSPPLCRYCPLPARFTLSFRGGPHIEHCGVTS